MEQKILERAAEYIEKEIDRENSQLDNILNDEESLKMIRKRRIAELKENAMQHKKWLLHGHGKVNRCKGHKDFFRIVEESKRIVAFFYKEGSEFCEILEKHLRLVIPQHRETKFVFVDAEKSIVLAKHLTIWMLPTMVLIKNKKTEKSIIGLDELDFHGTGNFKTKDLENLLLKYKIIKRNKE